MATMARNVAAMNEGNAYPQATPRGRADSQSIGITGLTGGPVEFVDATWRLLTWTRALRRSGPLLPGRPSYSCWS